MRTARRSLVLGSLVVGLTLSVVPMASATEAAPAATPAPANPCLVKIAKGASGGALAGGVGTIEAGGIGAAPGFIAGAGVGVLQCS